MTREEKRKLGLKIIRPLAENTLARIYKGVEKFVLNGESDFIVRIGNTKWSGSGRQYSLKQPLTTITSKNEHCLVKTFLTKYYGQGVGQSIDEPLHTITGRDRFGVVSAFITKFYSSGIGQSLNDPLHTITGGGKKFGLVFVSQGEKYQINSIEMRMLVARELFNAQGFDENYIIDVECNGKPLTRQDQVLMCGNSVPPAPVEAIIAANCQHLIKSNVRVAV